MGRTPPGETRKKVYDFVKARLIEGLPPTVREVQKAFGFRAVQTAREHLEGLVEQGLLKKEAGRSRGYRLPDAIAPATSTRLVPLLGRVQAGELTTAFEEPEGYLPIQSKLPEKELFALRVRGESMKGAAILEDDIVFVRKQASAKNGDIIVALVGDEATVKRLRFRGKQVELHPENARFKVIKPQQNEVRILGKVVEVRRYLERLPILEEPS